MLLLQIAVGPLRLGNLGDWPSYYIASYQIFIREKYFSLCRESQGMSLLITENRLFDACVSYSNCPPPFQENELEEIPLSPHEAAEDSDDDSIENYDDRTPLTA